MKARSSRSPSPSESIPPLEAGDRLTRAEFERRYEAMPDLKKAELIEGEVHMPSPVSASHCIPHVRFAFVLQTYALATHGVEVGLEHTVRLDGNNEFQPDLHLRILPDRDGQSRLSREGYIDGAPELVAEIATSSASKDLHVKLDVYERSGVREYLVWRTRDEELDWFAQEDGQLRDVEPDAEGIFKSRAFPGLWIHGVALLEDDMPEVLAVLQQGLTSPEHAKFRADLAARAAR